MEFDNDYEEIEGEAEGLTEELSQPAETEELTEELSELEETEELTEELSELEETEGLAEELSDLEKTEGLADELSEAKELDAKQDLSDKETSLQDEFQDWKETINQHTPDIDDATLTALLTTPTDRTWHQTELVDAALHPEYDQQRSFLKNEDTGEIKEVPYGTRGSQRPDGIAFLDNGTVSILESKNYGSCKNLLGNLGKQTAARQELWGEEVDLTYSIAPRFTVEEAEQIQSYCEDELGVNVAWQLK